MDTQNPHINRSIDRVPSELVERASHFQAAILADVAGRRGAADGRLKPLRSGMKVAGPALTVEVRPGDNLMIHAAMQMAKPGDVLVIDGKGDLTAALMGTLMFTACKKLGIAGVVIDGAARDSAEIIDSSFPVFCVGTNPNGPTKRIPGRVGYPVNVGGVPVRPGDLVVGDDDGVVFIDSRIVASLLPLAQIKELDEAARLESISKGDVAAKWLYPALREAGVLGEHEAI